MNFITKWGCYQYTVMPFGLKNALSIFSRIAVSTFKDFIHKFLEVYFDDWIVFSLVRDHIESLCMMLECYRRYQIALNSKKCIFCAPFGVLLGHVVCHDEILVDPKKLQLFLTHHHLHQSRNSNRC